MYRARRERAWRVGLAAVWFAACAGNQPSPELVDPIIIPELAVEVDHVALFNGEDWSPLNRRMLIVWSGRKPYLLVFNRPCSGLTDPQLALVIHSTSSTLYARFDSVEPAHGPPCAIDQMYAIQREDVTDLKNALKR
jgi:Family of unknown function (DUF6491)